MDALRKKLERTEKLWNPLMFDKNEWPGSGCFCNYAENGRTCTPAMHIEVWEKFWEAEQILRERIEKLKA